jgi:hypothetical protein
MLALKDACLHPTTKKPYIQTSIGGRDNSPEGHQVVVLLLPPHNIPALTPAGRLFPRLCFTFRKRRGSEVLFRARSSTSDIREELGRCNTENEGCGYFAWCILAGCHELECYPKAKSMHCGFDGYHLSLYCMRAPISNAPLLMPASLSPV